MGKQRPLPIGCCEHLNGVSFFVALLLHRHVLVALLLLLLLILSRPLHAAAFRGAGVGHDVVGAWWLGWDATRWWGRTGYGRVEDALLEIGDLDAGGG